MPKTKELWIWAVVLPLLSFIGQIMCVWSSPRWLGMVALCLMLSSSLLMLPVLFAPFVAIYFVIAGIVHRSSPGRFRQGLLSALACVCFVTLSLIALIGGFSIRMTAFHRAASSGNQIVRALTRYKQDQGQYPDDLQMLVPKYLKEIPYTTLIGYPEFRYTKDYNDIEPRLGEYELRINCSSGSINFDRFIYWPSEKYPDRIQDNGVERMGTWAYVHE